MERGLEQRVFSRGADIRLWTMTTLEEPEDVSTTLPLQHHLNRNIAEIFDVNFFISIILLQFAFILGT